jgi:hypothetical protein
MRDLTDPRLMYLKAVLLLLIGLAAGALLLVEHPSLRVAALLVLCVWGFCRAYYFCFYVVEKYIDPSFRFAGLTSVVRHLAAKWSVNKEQRRRP